MSKITINQPEVSGSQEKRLFSDLTPEQKAERREFLQLKLEDLKIRVQNINAQLEELN